MDDNDRTYLEDLVERRTNASTRGDYWQGRIDEYVRQNAIDVERCPELDLRFMTSPAARSA